MNSIQLYIYIYTKYRGNSNDNECDEGAANGELVLVLGVQRRVVQPDADEGDYLRETQVFKILYILKMFQGFVYQHQHLERLFKGFYNHS